ncbi:MAG: hypothetical protein DI606_10035 [Sphingobium sp.]|nr:MAG: hypothetical protein DI606_10035 [Sphingobium sp.]
MKTPGHFSAAINTEFLKSLRKARVVVRQGCYPICHDRRDFAGEKLIVLIEYPDAIDGEIAPLDQQAVDQAVDLRNYGCRHGSIEGWSIDVGPRYVLSDRRHIGR